MLPKQVIKLDLWKYYSLYRGIWNLFLQDQTLSLYSNSSVVYSEEEPALQCRRQHCAPDSSSLKTGSGATEGVLDKGVSGQPDYILWPDCWTMKIQDSRLRPVSGWDSPWRGRHAWQYGYVDFLPCNRLCVTLAPSGVYINWRV